MNTPTVSVILPTHYDVSYLPMAVDPVRNQRFTDWELIILDDGSTDAIAQYLGTHQSDTRIKVLYCQRIGSLGYRRNKGIDAAKGAIITFQDSDNIWYREKLESQFDAMMKNPGYGWSYHRVRRIDYRGTRLPDIPTSVAKPASGFILVEGADPRIPIAVHDVAIWMVTLRGVDGFREEIRYTEQNEQWFRLAESSPCLGIDEALCAIRTRDDSYSQGSRTRNFCDWMTIYHELLQRSTGEIRDIAARQMVRCCGLYARKRATEGSMHNAIRAQTARLAYHRTALGWWLDWMRIIRQ